MTKTHKILMASTLTVMLAACSQAVAPTGADGKSNVNAKTEYGIVYEDQALNSDIAEMKVLKSIPSKFQGTFALDQKACKFDNTYNPSFQTFTVLQDRIKFFETEGILQNADVSGENISLNVIEIVGDSEDKRTIKIGLIDPNKIRYTAGANSAPKQYVSC